MSSILFVVHHFLVGAFVFLVQSSSWHGAASYSETTRAFHIPSDTISIIADPLFQYGLVLKRAHKPSPGTLYPFGRLHEYSPIWELAEWGSQFELSEEDRVVTDGGVSYANRGKTLSFEKLDSTVAVTMGVFASKEYDSPRVQNQAWPHLLIEQAFEEPVRIKDLDGLILRFTGRLTHVERKMNDSEYDPGLHTAQFQLFLTVQNQNPHSEHYGDFFWFGIPFYDYRHEELEVYAAQDVGKGDASGKFIYSAASKDFMEGTFHDQQWKTIEKNLLPLIIRSLEVAKERGYLPGSDFEDFCLSGMNMGWEVPGTFNVEFEFQAFDLWAVKD